jgi:hypothetical protein
VHHAIQVRAPSHNPYLSAIPVRKIDMWIAAEHVNGLGAISDVYWDVFQPCSAAIGPSCVGGFLLKTQVHFDSGCEMNVTTGVFLCNSLGNGLQDNHPGNVPEKAGNGTVENTCVVGGVTLPACVNKAVANGGGRFDWTNTPSGLCGFDGSSTTDGSMWEAAIHTGQITSTAEVDNTTFGFIELCREKKKAFYHAYISLTKDEPCGEYKVNGVAVAVGGNNTTMTNYFDVLCGINLQTDNTTWDWGTVIPGIQDDIAGDLNFAPGDGRPTIVNGNNGPMAVRVKFGAMDNGGPAPKIIDKFDAAFGRSSGALNSIGYLSPFLAAGVDYELGIAGPAGHTAAEMGAAPEGRNLDGRWILCANELAKLDVSLHPDTTLVTGTYTGTATLTGYLADGTIGGAINDMRSHCFGNYHVTEAG